MVNYITKSTVYGLLYVTLYTTLLYKTYGIIHNDVHMTNTHEVKYQLEIPDEFNFHNPTEIIIDNNNNILMEHQSEHQIGDFVTYRDNIYGTIFGKIYDISENITYARHSGFHEAVKSGKITLIPLTSSNMQLRGEHEKDVPFCYGFNTHDCKNPATSIDIFNNKYIDVSCDNCFVGLSGDIFIEIDIDWFRIKSITGGFKNLEMKGGLGVDFKADYSASYSYDKTYPVISKFNIASFDIGVIPVDIWLELPIELILNAGINAGVELKTGVDLDWKIDNLYLEWKHGGVVVFYPPSDDIIMTPYLSYSANIDGDLTFKILASLKLHLNNIFEIETDIIPETDFNLSGSIVTKQICLIGDYQVDVNCKGHVEDYTFGKDIFNTGKRQLIKKCV